MFDIPEDAKNSQNPIFVFFRHSVTSTFAPSYILLMKPGRTEIESKRYRLSDICELYYFGHVVICIRDLVFARIS